MAGLVRFSEATSIALHCAAAMAQQPGKTVNARQLADVFQVSSAHLAKVMQRLTRAGIAVSSRGPRGGFQLACPPETVSLLDVYEAVEGRLEPVNCLFSRPVCTGDCCLFGSTLESAVAELHRRLRNTKLSDLRGALDIAPESAATSAPPETTVPENPTRAASNHGVHST
ncbi:MAG: Rrf2 family transcriptional regulator [Kiritimatiellaeota bacterium]|nr:Rrf2 family transcriptional regulator [Kiritimatiellota bacterium]